MAGKFVKSLPRYFNIDGDILVKIYLDGETIRAINHWGNAYPPFDAVRNGTVTTRGAFEKAVLDRKGQPILASAA